LLSTFLGNIWKQILQWDLTTLATALVYLAIIALFIMACLRCIRPVRYCRRKLKNAIHALKKSSAEQPWQDKYFLGKGILYPVWSDYLNSRNFADSHYHNASPLEDYINEDTVIHDPGRTALSEAVPGLMVSLGFLGTLVGLMMGLSDFNMTDSETTMEAIRQVVSGMRYAFTTSIVGIVASISYSLLSRSTQGSARSTISAFYEIMYKQPGVQAVDPLTQITIYQQEQTALAHSIAEDLTGAMSDRLGAVLEMALQPLQDSLDSFVRAATREQVRAVDAMVARFVDSMDEALSRQASNLAHTLSETCRWQEETAKYVDEVMTGIKQVSYDVLQIQQMSESVIAKFDGYVNRLGNAQVQVDEGYAMVAGASRAMDSAARQQFECIAQLTELCEELGRSLADYRQQTEKAGTLAARQTEETIRALTSAQDTSAQALRQVSGEMQLSGQVLADAHSTFIKGMNQELNRTFEIFSQDLNSITDQFRDTIAALDETVRDVPALLRDSVTACREDMDRLQQALSAASPRRD